MNKSFLEYVQNMLDSKKQVMHDKNENKSFCLELS